MTPSGALLDNGFVAAWVPDRADIGMRSPDKVFDVATVASFSGKLVVDDHPAKVVDLDNIAAHRIGTVTNARRGDCVLPLFCPPG
jgi:hypothetical protein